MSTFPYLYLVLHRRKIAVVQVISWTVPTGRCIVKMNGGSRYHRE